MVLKTEDLRNETPEELGKRLRDIKKNLMEMRFQHASGALNDPQQLRTQKRDIARIMTVIREKELENENKQ